MTFLVLPSIAVPTPPGDDDADVLKRIGDAVRDVRKSAGLSQLQLADLLGIDQTTVSAYERGQVDLSILTIVRIQRVCHASKSAVFRKADLVDDDVEAVLESIPGLVAEDRAMLVRFYRHMLASAEA
jgi:transcriptional regulator with XRE-family HTH domain